MLLFYFLLAITTGLLAYTFYLANTRPRVLPPATIREEFIFVESEATPPPAKPVVRVPDGISLDFYRVPHQHPVRSAPIVLGRGQEVNVSLKSDLSVSRRHAEIRYENGIWRIVDIGSSNGVFVNGSRVANRILRPGDEIRLGQTFFRFSAPALRGETAPSHKQVGEITLLHPIGRGGEATVYKAHREGTGGYVAVKLPNFDGSLKEGVTRIRNEISVARRFQHPHLVNHIDSGEWQSGVPYHAMEYCEGGSLRRQMQPDVPLAPTRVREVGRQLAGALSHIHGHGYVHRDAKPENILIAEGDHFKLGDYGIVSPIGERGEDIGTPHYMSPEQIKGERLDPASDLYGMGCVLYELQAGRCPFEGTEDQVRHGHRYEAPQPLIERNPSVSPGMNSLVMQLLEKDPTRRPDIPETIQRLNYV